MLPLLDRKDCRATTYRKETEPPRTPPPDDGESRQGLGRNCLLPDQGGEPQAHSPFIERTTAVAERKEDKATPDQAPPDGESRRGRERLHSSSTRVGTASPTSVYQRAATASRP